MTQQTHRDQDLTFIIPTKAENLDISAYPTWVSIRQHHPLSSIYIVDSDSQFTDYADMVSDDNTTVSLKKNTNYDIGAYLTAIKEDQFQSNLYVCIHDSVILKQPLPLSSADVRCFYNFKSFDGIGSSLHTQKTRTSNKIWNRYTIKKTHLYGFDDEEQRQYVKRNLKKLDMFIPEYFLGVFGPIFLINSTRAQEMIHDFIKLDLPTNKNEQKAFERILGIYLHNKGIDLRNDVIEGDFLTTGLTNSKYIAKKIINRL